MTRPERGEAPAPATHPPLGRLVARGLARRCPRCGERDIWRSWFRMLDHCPRCGLAFERGESSDFWIGAYLINLVVAETSAVVIAAVMWIVLGPRASFNALWAASMALAIVMPLLFYPFARTTWLAFDLHFRPSEVGDTRR